MKKIILILLPYILLILNSCNSESTQRKKEIETTKYFIENKYNNIVDKNGIKQNYSIEMEEISKELMYDSGVIPCHSTTYQVLSYNTIIRYKLLINGNVQGEYDFPTSQVYCYLNGSTTFGRKIIYSPELNSKKQKKEFISNLTGQMFGCGEETNNKLIQYCIESLQACGMLNK